MTIKTMADLDKRTDELHDEAVARGEDTHPSGTYTFNNTDAAALSVSLAA